MRAAYIALVTSTLRPGISIHIRKTLRTPIIWVNFISSEAITVDETWIILNIKKNKLINEKKQKNSKFVRI